MVAQQRRRAEPAAQGDLLDRQIGPLEQPAGMVKSLAGNPFRGRRPGLGEEPTCEGAFGQVRVPGQLTDRQVLLEVLHHPGEQRLEALGGDRGDRLLDELPLTAVALRGNDHAPGDPGRDVGAELAADQVQAGVDARRGASAGEDGAVLDEEDGRVDGGCGIALGEFGRVVPVAGRRPAVEQARLGEDEAARTRGQDRGAGGVGLANGLKHRLGEGLGLGRGDGDNIGAAQPVEAEGDGEAHPVVHGEGLTRSLGAHPELERRHPVGGPVDAENLREDAEFERERAFGEQHGNGAQRHTPEYAAGLAEKPRRGTVLPLSAVIR